MTNVDFPHVQTTQALYQTAVLLSFDRAVIYMIDNFLDFLLGFFSIYEKDVDLNRLNGYF